MNLMQLLRAFRDKLRGGQVQLVQLICTPAPDGETRICTATSIRLDPDRRYPPAGEHLFLPSAEELFARAMEAGRLVVSAGLGAALYNAMKVWVDARNGRKLKIKIGDIEVEATQMAEKDVLRIFELVEEKADQKRIRDLLLASRAARP